ncbi:MAG TPA: zinc-binding dehydrogenase [Stellaceae bacterium]|nr:zinc-binding dehydrogenase [Stellaceae bacterium]
MKANWIEDYGGVAAMRFGERIAALVDDGKLKPQIATVLPLAEAARAYAMCREGNFRGKILLDGAGA